MPYSIGCDVSKRTLDVALMRETQDVQETFRVSNDSRGHAELMKRIAPFKTEARLILEATSHYHLPLALALTESGFRVVVLNPLIMKKFASSGIRKTKTDKADAVLLAKIGFLEPNLKPFTETRMDMEKKLLSQMIGSLKKKRRSLRQRLRQIEEMQCLTGASGKACITSLQKLVRTTDMEIKALEERLVSLVGEDARLLATIPGVGIASASRITAELGDVSRFRRRDQVTAFAGLDPSIRESGTSVRGRSRITKRGSPGLRGVLGQAAWGVMMHNPVFKDYYEKKKSDGKHYLTILMAIAKKLLLLIYGMLKSGASYDLARHREASREASGLTAV